ncbi:EAL domain-containing protein [Thauera sp.]|jgi:diguanylate cyclase (GGDEF)-like protein/PAS domain S-box-containing protein|uniref:sensor domain-containing protein n=1 Tax=Thauera sp. TaxID=1905334 RepID=UPI002610F252|nr:EAL domain-containing protein [Thauera sp.]MCK6408306.1 EAL domain-containing protein [Thauera sp.]
MKDDNARLRAAIDTLQVPIYMKDLDGRYVYANDLACALLRLPRSTVIGSADHELFPAEQAGILRSNDLQVIESGQAVVVDQYLSFPEAPAPRCCMNIKQPVFDAQGRLDGVIGFAVDIDERKQQEQELVALKNDYAAILQTLPDPLFEFDIEGRCHAYRTPSEELLPAPSAVFLGRTLSEVLPPEEAQTCLEALHEAAAKGRSTGKVFKVEGPFGTRWFELSVAPMARSADRPQHFNVLSREVTVRERMARTLQEQESLLRAVVDNTPVQYWARDLEGRCILQNAMTVAHWGDLLGLRPADTAKDPALREEWLQSNGRAYAGETVHQEVEYTVDGQPRIFQCLVAPIRVGGEVVGIFGFNQDITERKRQERQIHELAFFDPLTGLPNRRLMFDRLERALASRARRRHDGALLLIDLDHFKELNDSHGHEAGDQLLMKVAARLSLSIRQGDTAARLGGDEFVVILEDLDDVTDELLHVKTVADRISRELDRPFTLQRGSHGETITYQCSASIGISAFGEPGVTATELLRRADTAMYQAKAAGRNAVCFFDPAMQAAVTERATLHSDLREAIRAGQFELHYQVQVDAQRQPSGAEVLLRWHHPDKGLVFPGGFIDLAEETGLIVPLGHWVLATACRQLAQWSKRAATAHLRLAVNVSARQFRQPAFAEQVQALLEETGAPADRLKLELTESSLLEDTAAVIERMERLRALGIRFSLDDFGTGYSSLAYLKRLPLTQLKIDQSFVRDVMSDPSDATLVRTILTLGDSLGLAVIAEGVETEAQYAFLAAHGCRDYQGYLFGRPVPLEVFEASFVARAA